jgi:hypothetical protein
MRLEFGQILDELGVPYGPRDGPIPHQKSLSSMGPRLSPDPIRPLSHPLYLGVCDVLAQPLDHAGDCGLRGNVHPAERGHNREVIASVVESKPSRKARAFFTFAFEGQPSRASAVRFVLVMSVAIAGLMPSDPLTRSRALTRSAMVSRIGGV